MGVKGYKVFNSDWTCRRFQYEVGKTYEIEDYPKMCEKGFHFCSDLRSCFLYYSFKPETKVAEILALGNIESESIGGYSKFTDKCCTNKIKIVREIPWSEVLELVNDGKNNLGYDNLGHNNTGGRNKGNCNTGNCNRGDSNTGNYNEGRHNTGFDNIGDRNSGNSNEGDFNTGLQNKGSFNVGCGNVGDSNTGDYNIGNRNTGNFNKTNNSTGFFNTKPTAIYMFNKPTNWSLDDCSQHQGIQLAYQLFLFTDISKRNFAWKKLSQEDKQAIFSLPNFDADIFEEITGINVKED